jgi:hypothetical protein
LPGSLMRVPVHDLGYAFGSALTSAGVRTPFITPALAHTSTKMTKRYACRRQQSPKPTKPPFPVACVRFEPGAVGRI